MVKWSFSSLKQFVNCPKQYHEVKVLNNYKVQDTKYTIFGKDVHKAFEDYALGKAELPKLYKKYKPLVDAVLDIEGDKYIEHQLALRIDYTPCPFDAPDYWVRGIADLLIVKGDQAYVIDYKTGNDKYADTKQLKLMAQMIFFHFPQVKSVKGGLLFVLKNKFVDEYYTRDKIDKYWEDFRPDLMRLEMSIETGKWLKRPSGLCKFCPVSSCEFNQE